MDRHGLCNSTFLSSKMMEPTPSVYLRYITWNTPLDQLQSGRHSDLVLVELGVVAIANEGLNSRAVPRKIITEFLSQCLESLTINGNVS